MVYDKVKKLCTERGVTVMALEQSCGLGNGTVSKWATHSPRLDLITRVAAYFNVSLDELLRDDA